MRRSRIWCLFRGRQTKDKVLCRYTIGKLVVIVVRYAVDKFMDEATGSGLQEREGKGKRVPLFLEMAKGSMTDPLCVVISSNT